MKKGLILVLALVLLLGGAGFLYGRLAVNVGELVAAHLLNDGAPARMLLRF